MQINTLCNFESSTFPFYKTDAPSRLQDVSKVDVGSLGLSSHTSIGRLDRVGRAVLLVSDLVLPPHLGNQYNSKLDANHNLRRTKGDRGRWS